MKGGYDQSATHWGGAGKNNYWGYANPGGGYGTSSKGGAYTKSGYGKNTGYGKGTYDSGFGGSGKGGFGNWKGGPQGCGKGWTPEFDSAGAAASPGEDWSSWNMDNGPDQRLGRIRPNNTFGKGTLRPYADESGSSLYANGNDQTFLRPNALLQHLNQENSPIHRTPAVGLATLANSMDAGLNIIQEVNFKAFAKDGKGAAVCPTMAHLGAPAIAEVFETATGIAFSEALALFRKQEDRGDDKDLEEALENTRVFFTENRSCLYEHFARMAITSSRMHLMAMAGLELMTAVNYKTAWASKIPSQPSDSRELQAWKDEPRNPDKWKKAMVQSFKEKDVRRSEWLSRTGKGNSAATIFGDAWIKLEKEAGTLDKIDNDTYSATGLTGLKFGIKSQRSRSRSPDAAAAGASAKRPIRKRSPTLTPLEKDDDHADGKLIKILADKGVIEFPDHDLLDRLTNDAVTLADGDLLDNILMTWARYMFESANGAAEAILSGKKYQANHVAHDPPKSPLLTTHQTLIGHIPETVRAATELPTNDELHGYKQVPPHWLKQAKLTISLLSFVEEAWEGTHDIGPHIGQAGRKNLMSIQEDR